MTHLMVSFVLVTLGFGALITIWWLADGVWRLIQQIREARR